jgi:membrane associated rhomboid family serine protease
LRPVTGVLIALNVLSFAWEYFSGALDSDRRLLAAGAIARDPVLVDHQWWRIVSGGFLHGGLAHVALNMLALWQLGTLVESLVGSARMFAVYALALVGAGLSVVYFGGNQPTVGASGAIYGLFGALIAIGLRLGGRGRGLVTATLPILIINLVLTVTIPQISISAHVGGLVTGFVTGLFMQRGVGVVAREETVAQEVLHETPPPQPQ